MRKSSMIPLVPYSLALLLDLISIIMVLLMTDSIISNGLISSFGDDFLFGTLGLAVVSVLVLRKKYYWKHAFGLLLVLALTPWVSFFNISFGFGIGFLKFDLIPLGLLIFHVSVNREVKDDLLAFVPSAEINREEKSEKEIQDFQEKFAGRSDDELKAISTDSKRVPEAREAARRLLNERGIYPAK